MDSNDLPPLPEYRDNPFIARLPAILSPRQSARALIDLPAYSEAERSYPAHFRFHCLQRLTTYFDPLPQQIELELLMSMLIRQGYLGRNPNTTDFITIMNERSARIFTPGFIRWSRRRPASP